MNSNGIDATLNEVLQKPDKKGGLGTKFSKNFPFKYGIVPELGVCLIGEGRDTGGRSLGGGLLGGSCPFKHGRGLSFSHATFHL